MPLGFPRHISMTLGRRHTLDSLPFIIWQWHWNTLTISMVPVFISKSSDTNLNYMTTSIVLHSLSHTVNSQSNGISFNPDSQLSILQHMFTYLLAWMQATHSLLGLWIGLALQDHIRNGSSKIINGFLSLLVILASITPTLRRINWDQIWLKTWEAPTAFGFRCLSSLHFAIASMWHMQMPH